MSAKYMKTAASILAAMFVMALAMVAVVAPANAVSGDCSAYKQEKEVTGYNEYRSRASCKKLTGDAKARAWLIRDGGPDYYGSFFTTLNKTYSTGYYTCYSGCSASYQVRPV